MEIRPHLSPKDIMQISGRVATVTLLALGFAAPVLGCSNNSADGGASILDRTYPQCGGKGYSANELLEVTTWKDGKGRISYEINNLGVRIGDCGNVAYPFSQTEPHYDYPKPSDTFVDEEGYAYKLRRTFPQCGGALKMFDKQIWYVYLNRNTLLVNEYSTSDGKRVDFTANDLGPRPGECGNPITE